MVANADVTISGKDALDYVTFHTDSLAISCLSLLPRGPGVAPAEPLWSAVGPLGRPDPSARKSQALPCLKPFPSEFPPEGIAPSHTEAPKSSLSPAMLPGLCND